MAPFGWTWNISSADIGYTIKRYCDWVHFLVDRSGQVIRARCGYETKVKTGNTRLPEDFTVWDSEVTCGPCGGHQALETVSVSAPDPLDIFANL